MIKTNRGEIWYVELDPIIGTEEAKSRPSLVISTNNFNHDLAFKLVIILPITSSKRKTELHLQINPPQGGLIESSVIMCEQIRSVSTERFCEYMGKVEDDILMNVECILQKLLGFK
jgi:mRNA interferase MazF